MIKKLITLLSIFFVCSTLHAVEPLELHSEKNFIPDFSNRFSFLVGLNPNIYKATDITDFAISYGALRSDYWVDSNFILTRGIFGKLTTNSPSATTLVDSDVEGSISSLITFGVGYARRSNFINNLFGTSSIFEDSAANFTYNYLKETIASKVFTGPGMLAKFGMYYKSSDYFSIGGQFMYRLAVVKRSQDFDTETSSARSLTLSHISVGIDLSFFL